jgi:exodeoxyribonuclease V alpha subunit
MTPTAQTTTARSAIPSGPVYLGELHQAEGDLPLTSLDLAFARYLQSAQPSPDPRHAWLAALVSHQFGRGHACLDLAQLSDQGVQVLGWDSRLQSVLPDELVANASSLPWTAGDASPLVLDGPRLYLRRNWQAEQSIRASILARLNAPCPVAPTLAHDLDHLFPPIAGNCGQPDWQKLACALAARKRFTLITGGPGTGKTTTVARLLALLQSQAALPLRIALAAPTGKAAARLGESIGRAVHQLPVAMQQHIATQAQTLHKLLKLRSEVQATTAPALALDLVVVDEASMIDLEMMARLLAAVPVTAHLILLGDKDQLASVEAGAVMGQLCEGAVQGNYTADTVDWLRATAGQDVSAWAGDGSALAQQTVMLRHSHRFASNSVIGQLATAVNAGDRQAVTDLWLDAPMWRQDSTSSLTRLEPQLAWDARVAALVQSSWHPWREQLQNLGDQPCSDQQALALLQALARFQVLCALRAGPWGVHALNRFIGQALGIAIESWAIGRPVLVTRNDYNLNLMNGDVGLCLPTAKGLRVAFAYKAPDGQVGVRWVLPSRLEAVDPVFAMTVHKSQGSEFEHVALVLPDRITPVLTRELLYTGVTRAKSQLTLVVPQPGVLRQAALQQVVRSGGLRMV